MSYGFASSLRDALPNAAFIGFTGTPIEKTDANTRAVGQMPNEELISKGEIIGEWVCVLPHPGPLPLGEGETPDAFRKEKRHGWAKRGMPFSLSLEG